MNSQLLLSLCVLSASTASASDHFVNAPESIQAAMNAAAPGDRILVGPGTYSEVIDFQGKQLEVIATGGPVFTILDGSGSNTTVVRVSSGEPAGTSLSGFTLTNGAVVHLLVMTPPPPHEMIKIRATPDALWGWNASARGGHPRLYPAVGQSGTAFGYGV